MTQRSPCPVDAPLRYAFQEDSLDPGTRLLDIGLEKFTPGDALRTLRERPDRLSVALHEMTHHVSLNNTLGHLLAMHAFLANNTSNGIAEMARDRRAIAVTQLDYYAGLHTEY